MLIRNLERQGGFLFRWRSFVPLVLAPLVFVALFESVKVEAWFGDTFDFVWMLACLCLSMIGLAVRCATIGYTPAGTSGRNTRDQRAEVLNTTGMYSIVRNPLYLGNFIILLGVVLALKVWWLALVFGLAYWLYIERVIAAEERFLLGKFGAEYENWTRKTWAFVPKFAAWRASDLSFSLRNVLRREYNGFFAIICAFVLIEFVSDIFYEEEPMAVWLREDAFWIALLAAGALVFLTLRTLKKKTSLLTVEGR